ncbi:1-aminocyclopropane-1-carboxylate oxidase-like isoform X1 [Gossypium australe]|uniref:1-aminocyclopropane-1-carboxylate oxidase-like isoform X1 n=1 Tax=Gossypium australe TaxID=47621 RepID=A0A5B6VIJ1_9ROSI|nr:1-aminocyclopropane-1-carboxylate oxidase-like isoform X1 [Gossypium australe]
MSNALQLPIINLASTDRFSTANSIRKACIDHGFFYLVNHGVDEELVKKVFEQSSNFFSFPIEEKMKLAIKNHRGYTALYAEKLDTALTTKGDSKETFYVGPLADGLNQWPLEDVVLAWKLQKIYHLGEAQWRLIIKKCCESLLLVHILLPVKGLSDATFASSGDLDSSSEEIYGASAHSDYGMITLLMTDGVPGLQICREKSKQPRVWEDVPSMSGAFVVNIGDMMERWTNCLFRSTLHRVLPPRQERYSVAFFMDPSKDCIVECLESCCSEARPPRL